MAPYGSSYLFNGTLQAIIDNAPNEDVGQQWMKDAYDEYQWDKPEDAKAALDRYSMGLSEQFKAPRYNEEQVNALSPLPLLQAEGEGTTKIDNWEQSNLDKLQTTDDSDLLAVRSKLGASIKDQASELRNKYNTEGQNAFVGLGYRAAGGMVGGIAKLVGGGDNEVTKYIDEHIPHTSKNDDYGAKFVEGLESSAGNVVGVLGSGAAGFAVGGPIGAAIGAYGYMGATAAGDIRGAYDDSLKATGDANRATTAAEIEAGAQALNLGVGEIPVLGKTVSRLFGKAATEAIDRTVTKEAEKTLLGAVGSDALKAGVGAGSSTVVSGYGRQYGQDDPNIDPWADAPVQLAVGAVTGGLLGAYNHGKTSRGEESNDPPREHVNSVGAPPNNEKTAEVRDAEASAITKAGKTPADEAYPADFSTSGQSSYQLTNDGKNTARRGSDGTVYHPLDRTFYVSPEIANMLATVRPTNDFGLQENTSPDGVGSHLTTDGEKLIVRVGSQQRVIPAESSPTRGLHPVEVNKPRNIDGNRVEYSSHIGDVITETPMKAQAFNEQDVSLQRTGGAAAAEGREPAASMRARQNENLSDTVRRFFGTNTEGYFTYLQKPVADMVAEGDAIIGNNPIGALETLLDKPDHHFTEGDVKATFKLFTLFDRASAEAHVAGDNNSYREFAGLATQIGLKRDQVGVAGGRVIKAFEEPGAALSSTLRIGNIENELVKSAAEHVAEQEGVASHEIRNVDQDIKAVDAQIEEINTKAKEQVDRAGSAHDPEIERVAQAIKTEESAAEKDLKDFQDQHHTEADRLEKEADAKDEKQNTQLETKSKEVETAIEDRQQKIEKTTQDSKARAEKLHSDHATNEEAINKLEEGGKANAVKNLDKQIKDSEEVLAKAKKGGVVKPEAEARAKKAIDDLKAKKEKPEPVLSKEEQKLLNSLKRNREKLAKQVVETPKEGVLSEAEKKQIDKWQKEIDFGKKKLEEHKAAKGSSDTNPLRERAKQLREDAKNATAERVTNKNDRGRPKRILELKKESEKLAQKKEAAKQERIKSGAEAQQKATDQLQEKKARLTARKNKFDAEVEKRLARFTPEMKDKMRKQIDAASRMGGSYQNEVMHNVGRMERVLLKDNPNTFDWFNLWRANQLTNFATTMTAVVSGLVAVPHNALALGLSDAVHGRMNAQHFLSGALGSGFRRGVSAALSELGGLRTHARELGEIPESWTKSGATKEQYQMYQGMKEGGFGRSFVDDMPPWMKKLGLHNLEYTFRLLSAADALASSMVNEGFHNYVAKTLEKEGNHSAPEIADYIAKLKEGGGFKNIAKDSLQKAREEAAILHDVTGRKVSESQIIQRSFEIADQIRPEELKMKVNNLTSRDVLIEGPHDGMLGKVSEGLKAIANAPLSIGGKEYRPIRYMFLPFINISLSFLRSNMDVVPLLGAGRLLDSETSDLARHSLIGKQLMGTLMLAGIGSLAYNSKDDKDPLFMLNGAGPSDPDLRRTMQAAGWKPYTIQVKGQYLSYADTPFNVLFGAIGGVLDRVRFDKNHDETLSASTLGAVLMGGTNAFMSQSFLQSLGMVYDAAKQGGDKSVSNLADMLAIRPVKGFIPGVAALRMAAKMTNNDIETKADLYSKMVSGIPVVEGYGTVPALNGFGQTMPNNWEGRYTFVSKFWSERVSDPDWRWLEQNRYKVDFPDITAINMPKVKGTDIGLNRAKKLGAEFENVLTPQEGHDVVALAGPQVKQLVSQFRSQFGNSAYDPQVQKKLSENVSKIYAQAKAQVFSR